MSMLVRFHRKLDGGGGKRPDALPWCINTGKSLIPLTLRFLAQKRNLLIPLELSRVMHQGIKAPPIVNQGARRALGHVQKFLNLKGPSFGTRRGTRIADQRMTVSGFTMTRTLSQSVQILRNSTQNQRSTFESRGRFTERRSTASCCRRATFSRASSRRALKAEMRAGTNDEIMPAWCWQT